MTTTLCKRCYVPVLVLVMIVFWIAGCASPPSAPAPSATPSAGVLPAKAYVVAQQTVYGAWGAYEAGITLATVYMELPRCPKVTVCSDQKVVDALVKARNVARDALRAADTIAFSNVGGDAVKSAVDAADASLKAFLSITNTLRTK